MSSLLRSVGQWLCVAAWMVHDECGPYWLQRSQRHYASVIFYTGVALNKASGNLVLDGTGQDTVRAE